MKHAKFFIATLLFLFISIASFAYVAPITGIMNVCVGTATTLGDTTTSGIWSSSNIAVATVDGSGSVTGVSAGTVTITYTAGTYVTATITVNPTPAPISAGASAICAGSSVTLADTSTGGSWSSSNPAIATVAGGTVTGLAAGTVNIIYALSYGCSVSTTLSVNPVPAAISGTTSLCSGASALMSDPSSPGGNWTSGSSAFTIVGSTGIVTGIATGSGNITYTLPSGCVTTHPLTVLFAPAAISGSSAVCVAGTTTLFNATSGGIWSSAATTVATVSTGSGTVTGITPGGTTITYTLGTGCSATMPVSVNPLPLPITGYSGICGGSSTILGDFSTGGTWSSSNTGVVSIDGTSGVATGIAAGTAVISYTISTSCAALTTVTVYASPSAIIGSTSACVGSTTILSDLSTGGAWSSSNTAIAIVASGVVTGITAGSCNISYTLGTGCVVSRAVAINALPATFTLSGGGAYCTGGTGANIGLSGSETGTTYQLLHGTFPVGLSLIGTGASLDFGPQSIAGTYTVVATNNITGCTNNMLGSTGVTVNPLPTSFAVSGGGTFCAGGAGAPVSISGSQTGTTYQLYNGGLPVGASVYGTGSALFLGYHAAAGTYSVVALNTATACTNAMAGSAVITVNPLPFAYAVAGGGSYCSGGAGVPVELSNSQTGVYYTLLMGGAPTGLHLFGNTGTGLNFGYQATAGTYSISAEDTATGCASGMSGSATVTVNPLPVVYIATSSPTGYCVGGSGVHVNLTGSQVGIGYQLYYSGVAMGALLPGSGSPLDFGLITMPGSYTIGATNTTTGCAANMWGTASVYEYPLPSVYNVTGGGAYCSGGTGVLVGLNSSTIGVQYQLYNGTTIVGAAHTGAGTAIDFGLQAAAGVYSVVATNPATSCSSNMALTVSVSVTPVVIPAVTMSIAPGDTVCAGIAVTYMATPINGGTAPTYVWTVNGVITNDSSSYNYIPANGDIVSVVLTSNAACAAPLTATTSVTAHVITVPAISGTPATCLGSNTSLADSMVGGIWSTSDPAIGIISTVGGSTGVVTGMATGIVNMTYTISSGCFAVVPVTVDALPSVSASASATCGGNTSLLATGGTIFSWLPTTGISCDTCAATTANPAATTTYTVTVANTAGCTGNATVTVNGNRISGFISYSGSPSDSMKVWLIQFNPSDSSLIAEDSTLTCMDGGTPYYEFDDKPAGNYMVKAKLLGQTPGVSGYIPTYGLSTPYWYDAANIVHASATDTLHISMVSGVVPAGLGFIGGLISAGAGRGTSGDAPAQDMLVYLVDAVSNFVLTYTYTDASGAYSFNNVAYGNYLVYPENYSFTTIPSSVLMLSSTADSAMGVNFRQYNNSKVIKPITPSGINVVAANTSAGVSIFPNPATDVVNLMWGAGAQGSADVLITDITGRAAYHAGIDIDATIAANPGSPLSHIALVGWKEGLYIISVKGNMINYSGKLIVN